MENCDRNQQDVPIHSSVEARRKQARRARPVVVVLVRVADPHALEWTFRRLELVNAIEYGFHALAVVPLALATRARPLAPGPGGRCPRATDERRPRLAPIRAQEQKIRLA